MKHGSLFAGGGGFDLAAKWMGWENSFHVEINSFGRKILNYYWPNAISYEDITKTDFTIWRGKINVLTGGFPCQPFSSAGKRGGTGDNRYLWPEYVRAIQEIKPTWIVAENVRGITSIEGGLVFERVCLDMETEGYEVQPVIIPSVATDADHRRERVFFIAHSEGNGNSGKSIKIRKENGRQDGQLFSKPDNTTSLSDSDNNDEKQREHAIGRIRSEYRTGSENDTDNPSVKQWDARVQKEFYSRSEQQVRGRNGNGDARNREHWLEAATRLCTLDDELPGRLDGITFSKWRTESLKMAGNAVDPDVVYEIFKAIQSCYV